MSKNLKNSQLNMHALLIIPASVLLIKYSKRITQHFKSWLAHNLMPPHVASNVTSILKCCTNYILEISKCS